MRNFVPHCQSARQTIQLLYSMLMFDILLTLAQVVGEMVRVALLVVNLSTTDSQAVQEAALSVFVPMLIDVAAPVGSRTPALADMAVRVVTHLATGASSAAFKAVVAALPLPTKQRLQV